MKNYRKKLRYLKTRWTRATLKALVMIILISEWVGTLSPAQMIVPAALSLSVNMIISLGVYQSVYAFFLVTLVIIVVATTPMLFRPRNAHWVGTANNSKYFGDVITYTVLQVALGAQAYLLTRHQPESFASLLFASFLVSIISVFIFKSYLWLRLSKAGIKA